MIKLSIFSLLLQSDPLLRSGKINAVLAVISVIFVVFIAVMVRTELRTRKLEKQMNK